ncbi:MAG: bifunctional glutamate N-acetyltransferase/amino-acid acetyltransferase ArgJ [Deltaproteobacteria bacterium]|nr:bifunctional glutamate N-acetyltransferase/amino-acid acetyltransferase ArgJ [Deltaproteobacteria bacterium]
MTDLPPLGTAPLKQCPTASLAVPGFTAAATHCGLKKNGRPDLALIVAEEAVPAAGVFTKNKLAAAPVQVCRRHVAEGRARLILANSGGANAATGQAGLTACLSACQGAAAAVGCPLTEVLCASTGVIGQVLDASKPAAALPDLAARLAPDGLAAAAGAIMTTDTFAKMAERKVEIAGRTITVGGMAKGAGMIRPDMATLLVFVLTDAKAGSAALAQVLREAAGESFNRVSVDGDMSTNDTLLLLASGRAGGPELLPGDPGLALLAKAVTEVCQELATMIVADGEGAAKLVRVVVQGAPSQGQAREYCYAIAHSPLVKTAFAAGDPYWGRILSAAAALAGQRAWEFEPARTRVWFNEILTADQGLGLGKEVEERARVDLKEPRFEVTLDLGLGEAWDWVLTCDLTQEYVAINVDYRS